MILMQTEVCEVYYVHVQMHILGVRNLSCTCAILGARWSINRRNIPRASVRVTVAAQNTGNALVPPINVNGSHVADSLYSMLKSAPFRTRRGYI